MSGEGSPQISLDGGSTWVTSGVIANNSNFRVRLTTAAASNTTRTASVTVGSGAAVQWQVTTVANDDTPDAFTITSLTGQELNTMVMQGPITVTGIGPGAVPISVSGEGNPIININNDFAWVTSGTITNNSTFRIQMTTAGTLNTTRTASVTIGNGPPVEWQVTTVTNDNTPDAFTIPALTGQAQNTLVSSSSVTITGIGPSAVPISVSGSGSPQISLDGGGTWVTSGNISNNGSMRVRLTTANTAGGVRSASVTIGSGSPVQWDVTTTGSADACTTGAVRTACADGSIYAGTVGGHRVYAAPTTETTTFQWKTATTTTAGTTSTTDGSVNTAAMIAAGAAAHPAANVCNTKSPAGTWYLPAKDELAALTTNLAGSSSYSTYASFSGAPSSYFWSSSEVTAVNGAAMIPVAGNHYNRSKTSSYSVRCVRQ